MYIAQAAYAFRISGQPVCCVDFGHGHINCTLKITTDTGHMYVLQRINNYVFKDPVKVMANASAVTNYLLDRCSDPRAALHFIPTLQGQYYHRDQDGEFWRMYDFVDGFCLDTPESDADFYESALAFGTFQELLSDFPDHNLIRARTQFALVADMQKKWNEMHRIVAEVANQVRS